MSKVILLKDSDYGSFLRTSIRKAKKRIFLNIFSADLRSDKEKNFEVKHLIHLLAEARWSGIDVRVLISDLKIGPYQRAANDPFFKFAVNRGIDCRWAKPFNRESVHSKIFIFDQSHVIFGTHNISQSSLCENKEVSLAHYAQNFLEDSSRNFLKNWSAVESFKANKIKILSPQSSPSKTMDKAEKSYWNPLRPIDPRIKEIDAQDQKVFDALMKNKIFELNKFLILKNRAFSHQLIPLLDGAQKSVYITTSVLSGSMSSDFKNLILALCRTASRSIDIRLIYGSIASSKQGLKAENLLRDAGVKVHSYDKKLKMHQNQIIIDESLSLVGSHNFTPGSLFKNEEVSMICESKPLNEQLKNDFFELWAESSPMEYRDTITSSSAETSP